MRRNAFFAACAASAVVAAPALAADSTTAGVEVSTVTGNRTLSLLSLSGTPLTSASTIETGPGKTGAFLTAVTDTNYNRADFQVTSTLTNLTHATDATAEIPSSAVDVTVPANPLDITGVSRVVTPVFTVAGDLTGAVLGGLVPGTSLTSVTTTVEGIPQAVAGDAEHILDGTLATLPIGITKGAGGNFTTPTTPVTLMTGNVQAGSPTDILARLQTTVGSSQTAAALVSGGYLDSSSVMSAVSTLLGVPVSMLDETKVLAQLNGSVTSLTGDIVRQTGVYTSNQALEIAIPATAPTGTYRGVLTVTLADVP